MGVTAGQEREVSFIAGVNADGTRAAQSFWTWNRDNPATYGIRDHEAEWGPPTAGTGATISVALIPPPNGATRR